MSRPSKQRFVCAAFLLSVFVAAAADWPQYRGPTHDGISTDRILKQWPIGGPPEIWRVICTNGMSSLAVSGGRVFTQIRRNNGAEEREVCVGLDANTGEELWAVDVGRASYPDGGVGYDDGPRTTPSVQNGCVFVLSSYLVLYCLNATNGATLWSKNLVALYGGSVIGWQNAASPLLDENLIYVSCYTSPRSLLALSITNGNPVWTNSTEALTMTHSTPVIATIQGTRQVIFATHQGLVGLNLTNGSLLWKANYPFTYSISIGCSPVVYSNIVFITADYTMSAFATQVTFTNNGFVSRPLWTNSIPKAHWMTPVCHQGFLYGQFGVGSVYDTENAQLKCIDLRTGAQKWSTNGFGRGGTILVDNYLLTLTEVGDLVLSKPNTNAYTEIARYSAFPGYDIDTNKCWNVPAVADGRIYARSTYQAICLDVSVPALKMLTPRITSGNHLQLWIGTATGAVIDSSRLTNIQVRATSSLATNLASWSTLTNALVLTNGLVRIDNVDNGPRRYYIATEQ